MSARNEPGGLSFDTSLARQSVLKDGGLSETPPTLVCFLWGAVLCPEGADLAGKAFGGEVVCGILWGPWAARGDQPRSLFRFTPLKLPPCESGQVAERHSPDPVPLSLPVPLLIKSSKENKIKRADTQFLNLIYISIHTDTSL